METYHVVLVTAQSQTQARRIAKKLLQKRLAACVNIVPVESLFMWQGEIQEEDEVLMIIKTRASVFDDLMATVRDAHSYDTPEIIGLPIIVGANDYLKWISNEVKD
ncbi:MAG: divalent-cation tolerance protein CutA [Anaerolineae bacterium]|nr:divalent-cation tolerance protein CutA [Anaerolineae bacterium]